MYGQALHYGTELLSIGFEHSVVVDLFDGDSVTTRRLNILRKLQGEFAVSAFSLALGRCRC